MSVVSSSCQNGRPSTGSVIASSASKAISLTQRWYVFGTGRHMMLKLIGAAAAFALACACSRGSERDTSTPKAPLYNNLGSLHHAITTSSPEAQRYFDQGLTLSYAFNHAE